MTADGVVALTVTVPLPTVAQATSSQETSSATVAVPAVRTACMSNAGTARGLIESGVGPGAVSGVGVNVVPSHVLFAARASRAPRSTNGRRNLALPERSLESVCARAACRLVRVEAFDPSFNTERAKACVPLPAAFALALNAPGRVMASLIQASAIRSPSLYLLR